MPFELPPDNPLQQLTAQAEMLGQLVAAYHLSLGRNGIADNELIGELVLAYAEHMIEKFYSTAAGAKPPPSPTVDE
jgi:hypothetical protein